MINQFRVYGVILARGGSKSIPNKNLAIVNGKSLLQRTIDVGLGSKYIDHLFISSDSDEIKSHVNTEPSRHKTFIERPPELATDTASSADAIIHLVENYTSPITCDIIIELMCTSPFKTSQDVNSCIEKLVATKADSVVAVTRLLDHHPARVKYIENDILVNFFPEKKESRRQDLLPEAYVRNGSIYAFTRKSLLENKSRYGGIVRPYIMEPNRSINIDEPNDLILANLIGEQNGW